MLSPFAAMRRVDLFLCALLAISMMVSKVASAQFANDPNLEHPTSVVTAQRDGYTISALTTHLAGATQFKYGIVLFPGHPGILRIAEENGQVRYGQPGNFLVRSRRHWLDPDTLVLVIDAPSDQWGNFSQMFRSTPRYGADVAALIQEAGKRFKVDDWTFVGTSEGSISAFHAARMNPDVPRVILTASVFLPGRNGPGLSGVEWGALKSKLLWVHHENDPCQFTLYRYARQHAEDTKSPLVTARGGGPGRGAACEAYTAHGFVGVEREAILAMRSWVQTGVVPPDVSP